MEKEYNPMGVGMPSLCKALAAAQAELKVVAKSGENKFDRYSYAKLEDYLEVARPVLARHELALVVSVEGILALDDRSTAKGGVEHAVRATVVGRIYHSSGEFIEARCFGEGQDRADKAVYKAITGAKKYLISNLLAMSTSDDPEADEEVGHAAPHPVAPPIAHPVKPPVAKKPVQLTHRQRANAAQAQLTMKFGEAEGIKRFEGIRAKYADAKDPVPAEKVEEYVTELEKAATA